MALSSLKINAHTHTRRDGQNYERWSELCLNYNYHASKITKSKKKHVTDTAMEVTGKNITDKTKGKNGASHKFIILTQNEEHRALIYFIRGSCYPGRGG